MRRPTTSSPNGREGEEVPARVTLWVTARCATG